MSIKSKLATAATMFDPVKTSSGTFFALISAATNRNFRHPFSMSVLVPGFPLVTAPLAASGRVLAHQLWSAGRSVLAAH